MNSEDKRRLLSTLCHGSIFFSSLLIAAGIPFSILLASEDMVVRENAKEALNFLINFYIAVLIGIILIPLGLGIVILLILGLISFLMPMLGIFSVLSNPKTPYTYQYIFRFLK
ncbi:MAG: DUF4870 domain-containing protein [Cyanobacteriota bacterium]|nr:DUF4870 domain-containing protein [Cyanobacteriota bacterium]